MEQTLRDYLRDNKPGEFRSVPHYFSTGDYITYFVSDERCYSKRLDDVVTVYLAEGSEKLIGCKVKGVKHILRTAGDFGVRVDGADDDISLGFFFFTGAAPDRGDRSPATDWYNRLREIAHVKVSREELKMAGMGS